MIRGWRRWDGSEYMTLPDIFVYPQPWDDVAGSLHLATIGPPLLVVEVLSKESYRSDLDLVKGKAHSYQRAGVREYLTLDPAYRYARSGGRGWRLADGVFVPWERGEDGRWASAVLPLAFGLEGARAAVHAADGHRILREGEAERTLRHETQQRHRAEALAERERLLREELERLHADELERLRRRLDELEGGH